MRLFIALMVIALGVSALAEDKLPGRLAKKGKLLFSDDFERSRLGDWKIIIPGFRVQAGVLVGTQDRADHGSVGRVYVPMKDFIMQFRFKLAGSPRFNLVFDDKKHKGSHAGHIARVAYAQRQIRLGDDKEGIMRNDIFAMRRDPKRKAEADKLIEGRGVHLKAKLAQDRWYTTTIEIVGDAMRVSLDGKPIGFLRSPGLAHPTKESAHFTVSGKATHFDNVRIWEAKR
ncbi:MAG: hypothetical protein CMO80_20900 [Verrucomicrobiales bacterium]|nr:hypothetical protein [Verrucomicrobiales bacterium]|tara:strand:+ start:3257 stop:3943 length:687 start_codon:yes stop_codon:yes gene_type:complete